MELGFQVTLPNKTVISDFKGIVFSSDNDELDNPSCTIPVPTKTSTRPWPGSYITTYSTLTTFTIESDGLTYPEFIYEVETPYHSSSRFSSSAVKSSSSFKISSSSKPSSSKISSSSSTISSSSSEVSSSK